MPPSQYVLLASLRGDPSDNLPGRARGGGEDRGQAAHQVRRPRRDLRPPRRADAQAAREPGGERGAGPLQRPHHPARARRAARRRRRPPDAGRLGPGHGRGHLRPLRDEDGLAAPGGAARRRRAGRARARQRGPGRPGCRGGGRRRDPGHAAPAAPAAPPFELRDVALPATAADVTKQLGELGTGRLALAARWNGMPGRSDLVALVAGGHRGRGGRPRRPGAGRPARRGLGGRRSSTASWPVPSSATRSRRPCARCCRSASTSPASRWTPAWRPTCSTPRRASTSWRSCASRRASSASTSSSRARRRADLAQEAAGRGGRRRRHGDWASASRLEHRGHGACSTTTSRRRSCGSWPRWRWPASASTGPSCRRSPTR